MKRVDSMKNMIFISLVLSLIFLPACKTRKGKRKGVETSQSEKNKAYDKIFLLAEHKNSISQENEREIKSLIDQNNLGDKKPEIVTVLSVEELQGQIGINDRALVISLKKTSSPDKKFRLSGGLGTAVQSILFTRKLK